MLHLCFRLRFSPPPGCIHEFPVDPHPLVAACQQFTVWIRPVKQVNDDALLLANFDGRQKIAVSSQYHGIGNLVLRRQLHQIHTQKDVNPLLLKYGATVLIATERELAEPYLKPGNAVQRMMKTLPPGESLAFVGCGARGLVRQAIVEVGPQRLTTRLPRPTKEKGAAATGRNALSC